MNTEQARRSEDVLHNSKRELRLSVHFAGAMQAERLTDSVLYGSLVGTVLTIHEP